VGSIVSWKRQGWAWLVLVQVGGAVRFDRWWSLSGPGEQGVDENAGGVPRSEAYSDSGARI